MYVTCADTYPVDDLVFLSFCAVYLVKWRQQVNNKVNVEQGVACVGELQCHILHTTSGG